MVRKVFIPVLVLCLSGCNSPRGPENKVSSAAGTAPDTLSDQFQFHYTIDDQTSSIDSADIDVHYSWSDSTLMIDAGKSNGYRVNIIVQDIKHAPGHRGNGWRSNNTKLAGSDSLIDQPTVTFYKNDKGLSSWNNLNDGFHALPVKDDSSIYIYSFRRTGERDFIIKGRVKTHLFRNVYESSMKEFNKDHELSVEFVIPFEDYYLDL
jgi:hypothetical protein